MPIDYIDNLEPGYSVRAKLNALIDEVNTLTAAESVPHMLYGSTHTDVDDTNLPGQGSYLGYDAIEGKWTAFPSFNTATEFGNGPPTQSGPGEGALYIDLDTGETYQWLSASWEAQGVTFAVYDAAQVALTPDVHTVPSWDAPWEPQYRTEAVAWVEGGTYYPQQMVYVNGYLCIANTETSEFPAPTVKGQPGFLYDGLSPDTSSVAKQVVFGQRYTFVDAVEVDSIRLNAQNGYEYSLYIVRDPLGGTLVNELLSYTAQATDVAEIDIPSEVFAAGETWDFVVIASEPDPAPVTFTGDWDYTTPANDATPVAGEVVQSDRATGDFRIHKIDDGGTDRSTELEALDVGDVIQFGTGTRWAIQSVTDSGTYMSFGVSPTIQESPDGVTTFTFETTTPATLTYLNDPNFYTANAEVQGFLAIDANYASAVVDQDAYAIDIEVQRLTQSADWDIYGTPGGSGGGGGGSPVVTTETVQVTEEIASTTLATAGEFDFQNIPQNYDRIYLRGRIRTTDAVTATGVEIFFNGDENSNNYHRQMLHATDGAASGAETENSSSVAPAPGSLSPTDAWAYVTIEVPDYRGDGLKAGMGTFHIYRDDEVIQMGLRSTQHKTLTAAITRVLVQDDNAAEGLIGELTLFGERSMNVVTNVTGGGGGGTTSYWTLDGDDIVNNNAGSVGIGGTPVVGHALEIFGEIAEMTDVDGPPKFRLVRDSAPPILGNPLGQLHFRGFDGTEFKNGGMVRGVATAPWSETDNASRVEIRAVAPGTAALTTVLMAYGNGEVHGIMSGSQITNILSHIKVMTQAEYDAALILPDVLYIIRG